MFVFTLSKINLQIFGSVDEAIFGAVFEIFLMIFKRNKSFAFFFKHSIRLQSKVYFRYDLVRCSFLKCRP